MFRLLLLAMLLPIGAWAQPCSTNNGTNCVCADGTTDCDLLPDLMISWYGMEEDYPTEYSQTGNGPENGRLRITGSTPNIGRGAFTVLGTDYFICGGDTIYDPSRTITTCPDGSEPTNLLKQRIYHKTGNSVTYTDRWAGGQTYHPTHGHNHVDDWVTFTLRQEDPNEPDTLKWPILGTGAKIGFCLMDLSNCNGSYGHCRDSHTYGMGNVLTNVNIPNFGMGGGMYSCSPVIQGISVGYVDIYSQGLDGMWIDIPPGTCNGDYWIVAEVDPRNNFLESNDHNNWTAMPITLTKQVPLGTLSAVVTPSSAPYLCNGSSVTLTANLASQYLWSTGDTTQSITVNQPGSYYVEVNGNCGVGTSAPITVSQVSASVPTAIGDTVCPGATASLVGIGTGTTLWYAAHDTLVPVHVGETYTIPSVNQGATYWLRNIDTVAGTSFTCTSVLVPIELIVEPPVVATIFGLAGGYLDTDSPIQLTAQPGGGTFSGRGITVDGNNRTYFSPALAGAGDSIAITYEYSSPLGCPADTVVYLTILHNPGSGLTSIADNQLLFYPNPATATVTIVQPLPTVSTLSFYDAAGKLALTAEVNGLRSVVDVSNLAKGLYLMRLDGTFGSRYGKLSKL